MLISRSRLLLLAVSRWKHQPRVWLHHQMEATTINIARVQIKRQVAGNKPINFMCSVYLPWNVDDLDDLKPFGGALNAMELL